MKKLWMTVLSAVLASTMVLAGGCSSDDDATPDDTATDTGVTTDDDTGTDDGDDTGTDTGIPGDATDLTCMEGYDCFLNCKKDAACIDGCADKIDDADKELFDNLLACYADECATGTIAMQVNNCMEQKCMDTKVACGYEVPVSYGICEDVYECNISCEAGDVECYYGCFSEDSTHDCIECYLDADYACTKEVCNDEWLDFRDCSIENKCMNNQCLNKNCLDEYNGTLNCLHSAATSVETEDTASIIELCDQFDECFGGELSCLSLNRCLGDCGSNNTCRIACQADASQAAIDQFNSIFECLDTNGCLELDDDEEWVDCQIEFCSDEINTCFGEDPVRELGCMDPFYCMTACDSSSCTQECIGSTTEEAAEDLQNLLDCALNAEDAGDCDEIVYWSDVLDCAEQACPAVFDICSGLECSDNIPCDEGFVCEDNQCVDILDLDCDEESECPEGYVCDVDTDKCVVDDQEDDVECDEENACDAGFVCVDNECIDILTIACDVENPCPEGYLCDGSTNLCIVNDLGDEVECDEEKACGEGFVCIDNECVDILTLNCDEENPCPEGYVCEGGTDLCVVWVECNDNTECDETTQFCFENECVDIQADDIDCDPADDSCPKGYECDDSTGYCVIAVE